MFRLSLFVPPPCTDHFTSGRYIDETIARDNALYDPETKAKLAAQASSSSSAGFNGAGSRNILTGL